MTVREPERCASGGRDALEPPPARADAEKAAGDATPETARLREIIDRHHDSLWRTLRYLGVPQALADDSVQNVFCVLARRLSEVARGAEMSFLFATAMRVAAETRRAARRDRLTPVEDVDSFLASGPNPEDLLDQRRAHEALGQVLEAIPVDERMVFVLFEIEELKLTEIAGVLGIPMGTVASRLRRARKAFQSIVQRRSAAGQTRRRGGRS